MAAPVVRLAAAPVALDDVLRQIPGFTLFRRSGSRTANPTAQGPSLRGIGGSGASRALVLADGVPLNDPFGGWVAWGRVPRLALAQADADQLRRALGKDRYREGVLADEDLAQALGISGVPAMAVRNASAPIEQATMIEGAQPYERVREVVERHSGAHRNS